MKLLFNYQFSPALAITTVSALALSSRAEPATNRLEILQAPEPIPPLLQRGAIVDTSTNAPPESGSTVPNSFSTNPTLYGTSAGNATSAIGTPGPISPISSGPGTTNPYPLVWGPFTFHPHLDYGFTYGTGINFSPSNPEATAVHTVSPGLTIVSKHISLDYTPSLVYYSKGNFRDTVNQSAILSANLGYGDWSFGLSQNYSKASSPLVETGTQTDTESFGTTITASYKLTQKTSFDLTASQQIQDAAGFQGSRQWSTMDWLSYKIRDPLSAGIGIGGGYVDVDLGSNMSYEQVQGRLGWIPSTKTSINLNGGIEIRQFLGLVGVSDKVNPIMGASFSYSPFDHTTLSFIANRAVNTSLFENQVTEDTTLTASLNQRLLARLNLNLSGGYRKSDYQATSNVTAVDRSDDYSFVTTSLGTPILKRGSVSISYLHSKNKSSFAGFGYDSDQYSFQLGYRF